MNKVVLNIDTTQSQTITYLNLHSSHPLVLKSQKHPVQSPQSLQLMFAKLYECPDTLKKGHKY